MHIGQTIPRVGVIFQAMPVFEIPPRPHEINFDTVRMLFRLCIPT